MGHVIFTCNGKCKPYIAIKESGSVGRYQTGQKRCNICDKWIRWEGIRCPCCNHLLRYKPRNSRFKTERVYIE